MSRDSSERSLSLGRRTGSFLVDVPVASHGETMCVCVTNGVIL